MRTSSKHGVVRLSVAMGLSFALAVAPLPTVAFAASSTQIQAELDAAYSRLNEITEQSQQKFFELEDAQAQLEDTHVKMGQIEDEIAVKEGELVIARDYLSKCMADGYKSQVDFVSFVLGSTSFEDFASRIYYANKVASHQTDAIHEVLDIEAELEEQQAQLAEQQTVQEQLLSDAQQRYEEIMALQRDQQDYVNGLSAEVQAAIEEERRAAEEEAARLQAAAEAEAARMQAAAEEQARQASAQQASEETAQQEQEATQQEQQESTQQASEETTQQEQTVQEEQQEQTVQEETQQPEPEPEPESGPEPEDEDDSTSSSTSTYVPDYGSGVYAAIEYAKSQIGVSYSWAGDAIANQEFDCSGLVWWSFNQAGIYIPRGQRMANGRDNSMIGWCLDGGGWTTDQSQLQAGDLMFWGSSVDYTTHVALCIGGGLMIHSSYEGVGIDSVYYDSGSFVGGGPIV